MKPPARHGNSIRKLDGRQSALARVFTVCLLTLSILLAFAIIVPVVNATGASAYNDKALILVDSADTPDVYLSSQATLENLLGHFDLPYDVKSVDSYTQGDVDNYRVTFYLGTNWDQTLPAEFLDDVLVTDSRVVWINYNLWKLGWDRKTEFESRFGIRYIQTLTNINYNRVTFNSRTFSRQQDDFAQVSIIDAAKAKALSQITNGTKKYPHTIQSGNFFYIADDPMTQLAPDSSYLVFCELLHDMTGIQHSASHRALVRIEDVDPTEDPNKIRAIADYLSSENVPFTLGVTPRFADPLGVLGTPMTRDLVDNPELVSALEYAVSRGGTIVMHGFTHQYGAVANPYNGLTGTDSEFYIQQLDGAGNIVAMSPVPEDSTAWVQARIDGSAAALGAAGFSRPPIWETPHYLASELDREVFSDNFATSYERFGDTYFPFVINRSSYGSLVIPENLGYIAPGVVNPQAIVTLADKNLAVRDGFASFFYHSEVDISYLKTTVSGIKAKGYTFVDVGTLTPVDLVAPEIFDVLPAGIIFGDSNAITIRYNDPTPSSGIDAATVNVTLDGSPLNGCTVSMELISCPYSGLGAGVHTIAGSVSDRAGNTSAVNGTFEIQICGVEPDLSLFETNARWVSYTDYISRLLTVDYLIKSDITVSDVVINGTINTNGVLLATGMPISLGEVSGGVNGAPFTLKYNVPHQTGVFRSMIFVSTYDACGSSYHYPGPWQGA
ncbi:MAG: DUF2334 domain-containing protein [Thermoleophilia bacterium]